MVPIVPIVPLSGVTDGDADEASRSNAGIPVPVVLRARLHYGSPLFGYVLSIALTTVAGVFRLALGERGDFFYPFVFFQPAVAAVSFLAGVGPGLATIVLGAVFGFLFFPYAPVPSNWIALAVVGSLLATGFAHLRFIRDRNRAIAHELVNFKLIGDHASDWILLLGEAGRIRYVNLKASMDLGWADDELTGRHIESLVPEAQRPILNAALEKAKSGTAKPVELAFERRDKSLVLIELGCTA